MMAIMAAMAANTARTVTPKGRFLIMIFSFQMSRQLTGVTMQEPGVSRLVSVDLDEAVKMAAS